MAYQITTQQTLIAVVQDMATLLSLPKPVDPAGSTDPAVQLMVTAANLASVEMISAFEWPETTKRAEILITTNLPPVPGEALEVPFDLPPDFFRFIDQTQWNGGMQFPAIGPVSPQHWQTYMVFPISSNFTLTWMVRQNKIWFLNPPAAPGQTFKFMYISRAVVIDADDPDLQKNIASKNGDTFILDPLLLMLTARVKWLEAKGFDTSAAVKDMMYAFDTRTGASKGANILNMANGQAGYPYLNVGNLPSSSIYGMRN